MKKSLVGVVILATVLWFSPDRPVQVLSALRKFTQALAPGLSPDAAVPGSPVDEKVVAP